MPSARVAFALLALALTVRTASAGDLLIRDARVIDGSGAPARERTSILVRDGRIADIGPALAAPPGARVIDATGLSALPGLIDSHVHFVYASGSGYRHDTDADVGALNRQHLRAYLACGVTTVLDAGAFVETARDIQGWLAAGHPGPRYLTLGPYPRAPDGYGHPRFGEESTPAEVEAKLDLIESLGAVGVKLAVEHGFSGSGGAPAQFTPELMQAVVSGARRRGLPLYVHATNEAAQSEALDLGAHALMHAALDAQSPTELSPEFVARLRASGAYQLTTLSLFATFPSFFDRARLDDPLTKLVVPRVELETASAPDAADYFAKKILGYAAPWTFEFARPWLASFFLSESRLRAAIEMAQRNLMALHRAGVPIVVATDAPSPWPDAIHHFHGVQTLEELQLLGAAGLTPLETIAAATSVPARMLGLGSEIGTLAPGKRAELVLVEGDADRDLAAVRRVRFTVQGGVARTPEEWMAAP
jgi:imidazolonepropionase-like amidohydrolase